MGSGTVTCRPMTGSLGGLRFALVGPGRVGTSLAGWIAARGGRLQQVAGRSDRPAATLAAELDGEATRLEALDTAAADLLLLAVPDDELAGVAGVLARRPQAGVALHTCGSRGATVLAPLAAAGVATGSLHPLMAFPGRLPTPPAGLICALDGAPAALALAARLTAAFGAESLVVEESQRDAYHLAAVLSAGGLVTLLALAAEVARGAGLPESLRRGYGTLARAALESALAASEPIDALTGPWRRGDRGTVERELALLAAAAHGDGKTVAGLARTALRLLAARGELGADAAALRRALADPGFLDRYGGGC